MFLTLESRRAVIRGLEEALYMLRGGPDTRSIIQALTVMGVCPDCDEWLTCRDNLEDSSQDYMICETCYSAAYSPVTGKIMWRCEK